MEKGRWCQHFEQIIPVFFHNNFHSICKWYFSTRKPIKRDTFPYFDIQLCSTQDNESTNESLSFNRRNQRFFYHTVYHQPWRTLSRTNTTIKQINKQFWAETINTDLVQNTKNKVHQFAFRLKCSILRRNVNLGCCWQTICD